MLYMCEWERARGAFGASCMLFVVLSLREQKEKEIENKIPPKVRFLAKGWESFNDVIDAWWMLRVLSVFRGRRWMVCTVWVLGPTWVSRVSDLTTVTLAP